MLIAGTRRGKEQVSIFYVLTDDTGKATFESEVASADKGNWVHQLTHFTKAKVEYAVAIKFANTVDLLAVYGMAVHTVQIGI